MINVPKISVIIPIYNTAEYLPRCIDSILNNTYKNLEIICIDDGSTDESSVILERYAATDSRIISVIKANEGVSMARNAGLNLATGNFVAFVDSDDWVHPQYFETLASLQRQTDADIVICKYISTSKYNPEFSQVDLGNVVVNFVSNTDALKMGQLKRLVWGRLYKRNTISGLQFENGLQWGEDTVFNISVLSRDLHIALVDLELYYYFQRETSAMQILSLHCKLALANCYLKHYEKSTNSTQRYLYLSESIKQALACRYSGMFNMNNTEQQECSKLLKQCKKEAKESTVMSRREKLIYSAFIYIPLLYRFFRIIDDPTLLCWEKIERRKKKANKQHCMKKRGTIE